MGVRDEYRTMFGRQVLTLWSGNFAGDYEGEAIELPKHNGFMITWNNSTKTRVECPSPRDDDNWEQVDKVLTDYIYG